MDIVLQRLFCGTDGKRTLSWEFKFAFVSAAVMAFFTHLFCFTNYLVNHDSVETFYCFFDYLHLGRWASKYAAMLRGPYELTAVIAVVTILMLALTAAFIVRCLDLQDRVCIFLTSGFVATFPTVASVLAYQSEWFFIALVLSAVGAYCTQVYRRGWIAGILLIALSCGIYQSYLSVAIGLLLMDRLIALFSEKPLKDVVKRGLGYVGVLLAALVLYYGILILSLKINHVALSSYKGIDTIGFGNIGVYLASVPRAYSDYGRFFLNAIYLGKPLQLLQGAFLILSLCVAGVLVIWRKLYQEKLRVLLIVVGTFLIPLALSLTSVIAPQETNINILNQYAYLLQYVLSLKLFELFSREAQGRIHLGNTLVQVFSFVVCVLLCWSNFKVDNQAYFRMNLCNENTKAIANRIVMRIEEMEEYIPLETPVTFVGSPSSQYYFHGQTYFSGNGSEIVTGSSFWSLIGVYSTHDFFMDILGTTFTFATPEQQEALTNSSVVAEMPCYPHKDSIQYVDGVIVVKLSEGSYT